jgi:hypothetical protein
LFGQKWRLRLVAMRGQFWTAIVTLAVSAAGGGIAKWTGATAYEALWVGIGLLLVVALVMEAVLWRRRKRKGGQTHDGGTESPRGPGTITTKAATYSGLDYPGGFGASVWPQRWWRRSKPEVVWVEPRNPPSAPNPCGLGPTTQDDPDGPDSEKMT